VDAIRLKLTIRTDLYQHSVQKSGLPFVQAQRKCKFNIFLLEAIGQIQAGDRIFTHGSAATPQRGLALMNIAYPDHCESLDKEIRKRVGGHQFVVR
jgi:hypothetical protein